MAIIQYTLAFVCALAIGIAQSATAQSNTSIGSGVTTLRFAPSFESSVATSGLTLGAVDESNVLQGLFLFPVVEGVLDLDNARGEVIHGGGFQLAGPNLNVTFMNLIVDTTGATPYVTADLVVNNAMVLRIPILDAILPPLTLPLDARDGTIEIPSTSVTLRPEAADILNRILASSTFAAGQSVGVAEMTWVVGQSGV
jgi:hypothetical protein